MKLEPGLKTVVSQFMYEALCGATLATRPKIIVGSISKLLAKMIGITPA